jgi:hypothetical protein
MLMGTDAPAIQGEIKTLVPPAFQVGAEKYFSG